MLEERTLVRIMHTLCGTTMDHSKQWNVEGSDPQPRDAKVKRKYHIVQTETDISGVVSRFINQIF